MDGESSAHGWVNSALAETCTRHSVVQNASYHYLLALRVTLTYTCLNPFIYL